MEERYNVYFAGQVMDGREPDSVRRKLAKVFNADQATLDKLFSGKPQLIKRNCDSATAQKYKAALESAGAIPIIKPAEAATASTPSRPMSAAEKIAALAAAPDENRYQQAGAVSSSGITSSERNTELEGLVLTPPGTEVLREEERATPITRVVDTSALAVDIAAVRLSEAAPPPPAAPDTSHLSMGAVGDAIPTLRSTAALLSPNLDGLALSAPGTDFSDCAAPDVPVAPRDLSALAVLPPGVVPPQERDRRSVPKTAPVTDHLSLEE